MIIAAPRPREEEREYEHMKHEGRCVPVSPSSSLQCEHFFLPLTLSILSDCCWLASGCWRGGMEGTSDDGGLQKSDAYRNNPTRKRSKWYLTLTSVCTASSGRSCLRRGPPQAASGEEEEGYGVPTSEEDDWKSDLEKETQSEAT